MDLRNLQWMTKGTRHGTTMSNDIYVSAYKNKVSNSIYPMLRIRITRDKAKLFKSGYIQIAVFGNTLYIKESNKKEGYKMQEASTNALSVCINCSTNPEIYEWGVKNKGEYRLVRDIQSGVYAAEY